MRLKRLLGCFLVMVLICSSSISADAKVAGYTGLAKGEVSALECDYFLIPGWYTNYSASSGAIKKIAKIKEAYKTSNRSRGYRKYKYNKKGQLIKQVDHVNGISDEIRKYKYDKEGRLLREELYVEGFKDPSSWSVYYYDEDGRLQREQNGNGNREDSGGATYVYDDDGNIKRMDCYDFLSGSRHDYKIKIKHDKNGNITKITCVDDGETNYSDKFTYDKKGRLTKVSVKLKNGTKRTIKYQYGKDGYLSHVSVDNGSDATRWEEEYIYK